MTAGGDRLPECLWAGAPLDVAFLASIVDHVAHPIFVKDRSFRFVLLNRALSELVGFPREQMLGKTDYDFFPKEQSDHFRRKDVEAFETRARVTVDEELITDKEGTTHVLATTKVPLFDAGGEPTHVVGIIHDVTQLKQAEQALREAHDDCRKMVEERTAELRRAQDELVRKERLAVLGQLAGGVAHQIRNPLAAMQNAVSLLRSVGSRCLDDARFGEAIGVIEDEVRSANRIVTDLLEYARVRPPQRKAVDVGYVLEQALGAQLLPHDVRVVRELGDLPPAWIDADQVQVALYNVLRNALEAMPHGGTLRAEGWLEGDLVVLAITDSGPGISEAMRSHLFEPLVTTKPTGLGLGLTTARALIESQGGSLDWRDGPSGGARFLVRLPSHAG